MKKHHFSNTFTTVCLKMLNVLKQNKNSYLDFTRSSLVLVFWCLMEFIVHDNLSFLLFYKVVKPLTVCTCKIYFSLFLKDRRKVQTKTRGGNQGGIIKYNWNKKLSQWLFNKYWTPDIISSICYWHYSVSIKWKYQKIRNFKKHSFKTWPKATLT